jgi:UDP:flavonoid glycosyltransferase YjiC (YdhE family)
LNRQANALGNGLILPTSDEFEPEAMAAARKWYEKELGKKIFPIGPQLPAAFLKPPSSNITIHDLPASNPLAPVINFMNKAQNISGPQSVLYISFGTMFYPSLQPEYINAILHVLLEQSIPFVFSRAAKMFAPLPEELNQRIQDTGLGLVVDWAPQQELLGHPALMAFLTHGGANSMLESLSQGVVNIFWPMFADQPQHAAYLEQEVISFHCLSLIIFASDF